MGGLHVTTVDLLKPGTNVIFDEKSCKKNVAEKSVVHIQK